jgi:hypothetical protein
MRIFVLVGLISSLVVAVTWLENRHVASLPQLSFLFPTGSPAIALYFFALSVYAHKAGGKKWLVLAAILMFSFVLTGSRSTLVNLGGIILEPLLVEGKVRTRFSRGMGMLIGIVVTMIALGWISAKVLGLNIVRLADRYLLIENVLHSPSSDASYSIRSSFTTASISLFRSNPILGVGPGFNLHDRWIALGFPPVGRGANMRIPPVVYDTPLVFLANYGLMGFVVIAIVCVSYIGFANRSVALGGDQVATVAIKAWMITMLFGAPLNMPWDDRGFAFGLFFLIALALPRKTREPLVSNSRMTNAFPLIGGKGVAQIPALAGPSYE